MYTYESDSEKACEIARRVAAAHANVNTDKDVFARVTNLGDSAVVVTVRVWAEAGNYWGVKFDLTTEIRKALEAAGVSIPLVLHGASGLTDESVRECIAEGICKVNFATELRQAYSAGVKEVLAKDPDVYDPKKYGKVAMAKVQALVEDRIKVCGSNGKA